MKKLNNMVIVEEIINDGFINENDKIVVNTKTIRKAYTKDYAEKLIKRDETVKIIGDAYEVFINYNGKSIRKLKTIEEALEKKEESSVFEIFPKEEKLELEETSIVEVIEEQVEEKQSIEIEEIEEVSEKRRGRKPNTDK